MLNILFHFCGAPPSGYSVALGRGSQRRHRCATHAGYGFAVAHLQLSPEIATGYRVGRHNGLGPLTLGSNQ